MCGGGIVDESLMMELLGTWEKGRQQKKFMDAVKKYMQKIGAKEEDVRDRMSWRQVIPLWRSLKG